MSVASTLSEASTPRVLFVTRTAGKANYLRDSVFHGLVASGADVTDTTYMWNMSIMSQEVQG